MPLHRSTHVIGIASVIAQAVLVVWFLVLIATHEKNSVRVAGALAPSCSYREGGALPDAKCTPGALNHAVTQRTIHATICKSGWTTSIRPPKDVTEPQKFASMRRYGDSTATGEAAKYEFDHLIPLELGGAPDDIRNLWPEPHSVAGGEGSFAKDGVEGALRAAVCSGRITLAKARREIRTDWTKVTTP